MAIIKEIHHIAGITDDQLINHIWGDLRSHILPVHESRLKRMKKTYKYIIDIIFWENMPLTQNKIEELDELRAWIKSHFTGKCQYYMCSFWVEKDEDLMLLKLRWL